MPDAASILPPTKPRMSFSELLPLAQQAGLDFDKQPFFVAGVRGYYRDTMGATGRNDRRIYDDALFLVSPGNFSSFNANTDPSGYKPGHGFGARKGFARLKPGLWPVYRFDNHNGSSGSYPAICQRAGAVTVVRDGDHGDYEDTGNFGINIHRGGYNSTSSLGCQTIHPSQWNAFIATAQDQARRYYGDKWKTRTISYVLIEREDLP